MTLKVGHLRGIGAKIMRNLLRICVCVFFFFFFFFFVFFCKQDFPDFGTRLKTQREYIFDGAVKDAKTASGRQVVVPTPKDLEKTGQ